MSAKYEELRKLLAEIAATKKLRIEARAMWDANKGPWRVVQNRTHEIERMESKLSELAAVSLPTLLARLEGLERLHEAVEGFFDCEGNIEDAEDDMAAALAALDTKGAD